METIALDQGGFARLDVSDLMAYEADLEEAEHEANRYFAQKAACEWCGVEPAGDSSDYRVVADNRHFQVCALCWGRSPAYIELRGRGVAHDMALGKILPSSME